MTDATRTANNAVPSEGVSELWPACRLSRLVGKPSTQWTVDDLVEIVGRLRPGLSMKTSGLYGHSCSVEMIGPMPADAAASRP